MVEPWKTLVKGQQLWHLKIVYNPRWFEGMQRSPKFSYIHEIFLWFLSFMLISEFMNVQLNDEVSYFKSKHFFGLVSWKGFDFPDDQQHFEKACFVINKYSSDSISLSFGRNFVQYCLDSWFIVNYLKNLNWYHDPDCQYI